MLVQIATALLAFASRFRPEDVKEDGPTKTEYATMGERTLGMPPGLPN